jgi:hypothetical protein
MTRYFPLLETHIVLRTMIFGAGVLAVLLVLACAGMAAGAGDNNERECEIVMNYLDFEIGHFESPTEYGGAQVTIRNTGTGGADDVNVTFELVRHEDYSLKGHAVITRCDMMRRLRTSGFISTTSTYRIAAGI